EDVARLFRENAELVTYRNLDELKSRIRYYLAHDREREKIRRAGERKVRDYGLTENLKRIIQNVRSIHHPC
ncbi:MAG: glycosyltransferase, partial [bacterium]|nr:glycosyltransferase [bacterium]